MRLEGEFQVKSCADNSLIAAEGAIANVVGMTQMNPPVKDLCSRSSFNLGLANDDSTANDPDFEEST